MLATLIGVLFAGPARVSVLGSVCLPDLHLVPSLETPCNQMTCISPLGMITDADRTVAVLLRERNSSVAP